MPFRSRNVVIPFICLLILNACTAQTSINPELTATPIPPAETATQPAASPEPSPTVEPTALPSATPEPTATPIPPLAMQPEGLSGWCMPVGEPNTANTNPEAKPASAVDVQIENGRVDVVGEFTRCYFFAAFNQPFPPGARLNFLDGQSDFYQAALQPMSADPKTGWALVNHTYLVNPPAWELSFRVEVAAADGSVFYDSLYHITRGWTPDKCWNGALPDPTTLKCPLRQDLHPWDQGYGVY